MNRRMIGFILGRILLTEAALMIPSVITGLIYGEEVALTFLLPMALLLLLGVLLCLKKPVNTSIFARDGLFVVAAGWILMSLFGAMPLYFCGGFKSVWDCIFEIVSGFTTTGSSVLSFPERLPHCVLFWRSFSHWIGGMGVLVFMLMIVPLPQERSMHLMRAEAPGPSVGKLVPRMRDTARILYMVYTALTVILIIMLLAGGMPFFDSVCNAFATAGTGGFSISSAGFAQYNSVYIEMVIAVFMLLFGINFNLYYFILIRRAKDAFKNEEMHWYIGFIAAAVAVIAANIYGIYQSVGESLRYSFFQVCSIITTTGFSTADFLQWPNLSQHILLFFMVTGACAGSTGGGLKISRLVLLMKSGVQEVRKLIHPRLTTVVRLDGKPVDNDTMHNLRTYFMLYVLIIIASVLLISFDGYDFSTNFSAVLSCFNNIGPGIGLVGPASSFALFSPFAKMLLSLDMLLGRLEIFPIIILFSADVWKKKI